MVSGEEQDQNKLREARDRASADIQPADARGLNRGLVEAAKEKMT